MSGNPTRRLNSSQEEILRKYKEERNMPFQHNRERRYRISDTLYHNLFGTELDIPENHKISGKSTLYDESGRRILQWVKTSEDKEKRERMIKAILESLNSKIERAEPETLLNTSIKNEDLLNQYTITDYHLGMLSWHEETKADWDISIAENLLTDWFEYAISISPSARGCILAQIGDFLHFDGLDSVTPTSKHVLDSDTRFTKLVRVSIRVLRKIIQKLLQKYEFVHLILAEGNHDIASSVWLRELFSFHYENESRVTVDTSPDPYYCYEFGQTLLFYHHGHKRSVSNIDSVFVSKFKERFGISKHVYAHLGDKHSFKGEETNLMLIEQHRTLAAKDAYASRGGWMSGRDAKVITYHKEFGEVGRLTINQQIISKNKNE